MIDVVMSEDTVWLQEKLEEYASILGGKVYF
jgi:hypothetical protein